MPNPPKQKNIKKNHHSVLQVPLLKSHKLLNGLFSTLIHQVARLLQKSLVITQVMEAKIVKIVVKVRLPDHHQLVKMLWNFCGGSPNSCRSACASAKLFILVQICEEKMGDAQRPTMLQEEDMASSCCIQTWITFQQKEGEGKARPQNRGCLRLSNGGCLGLLRKAGGEIFSLACCNLTIKRVSNQKRQTFQLQST